MANIKLTNDYWETSGIYDITQSKTQRQINNALNGAISDPITKGKKYMCFGDSIISDDVTGLGTSINATLQTTLVGNYAYGNASCSDYYSGSTNQTTESSANPNNQKVNYNVLSNQVRRALCSATATGQNVTFTHPVAGQITLDTSIWHGTGSTANKPDVIYICIGLNDGSTDTTKVKDDIIEVLKQPYSSLTRIGMASALRWAIETLQSAFPNATIFVSAPFGVGSPANTATWRTYDAIRQKQDIARAVASFCGVKFIDAGQNGKFSGALFATKDYYTTDGVHPNNTGKALLTTYVSSVIVGQMSGRGQNLGFTGIAGDSPYISGHKIIGNIFELGLSSGCNLNAVPLAMPDKTIAFVNASDINQSSIPYLTGESSQISTIMIIRTASNRIEAFGFRSYGSVNASGQKVYWSAFNSDNGNFVGFDRLLLESKDNAMLKPGTYTQNVAVFGCLTGQGKQCQLFIQPDKLIGNLTNFSITKFYNAWLRANGTTFESGATLNSMIDDTKTVKRGAYIFMQLQNSVEFLENGNNHIVQGTGTIEFTAS